MRERILKFHPSPNTSPSRLRPEEVEKFNREGYLHPVEIFRGDEIEIHRENFKRMLDEKIAEGKDSYSLNGCQKDYAEVWELCQTPQILDVVRDLLGDQVVCWGAHYFCKLPGDGKEVSWHQDAPYWPMTPSKTITVWLAIDDSNSENGAMSVLPGSHLRGVYQTRESRSEENNVLSRCIDENVENPQCIELKAGQISLHSDMLVHGSAANRSTRRRCGVTLRYAPMDVRCLQTWNHGSIHVLGHDETGHWADIDRPESVYRKAQPCRV